MISKLIKLRNVGLFVDGLPIAGVEFGPVTLVYAENGRGKSTLADVLRSYGLGDCARLLTRRSLDGNGDPEVEIRLDHNGRPRNVRFENGAWSESSGAVYVFDSVFIDGNVYSGLEVRSEHRQRLLGFALGLDAVDAAKRVAEFDGKMREASSVLAEAKTALLNHAGPVSPEEFVALSPDDGLGEALKTAQAELRNLQDADQLRVRAHLQPLSALPDITESAFQLLPKSLEDVEADAEERVKAHLNHFATDGLEGWVSDGQTHATTAICPFCGQDLHDIELVSAYRSYFSKSYGALKQEITDTMRRVEVTYGEAHCEKTRSTVAINDERVKAWKQQVRLEAPALDGQTFVAAVTSVQRGLLTLLERKSMAPLDPVEEDETRNAVESCLVEANRVVVAYNDAVAGVNQAIVDFMVGVAAGDTAAAETRVARLSAHSGRFSPTVVQAVEHYEKARVAHSTAEEDKRRAKRALEDAMENTLQLYQKRINEFLSHFGAGFTITPLSQNFRAKSPQASYSLLMRGKQVPLSTNEDAIGPAFGSALSDGDKRSLALAFFLARIESDPQRGDLIVVVDDPVASLDENRTRATTEALTDLAKHCKQLIVLSHRKYTLRDLGRCLRDARVANVAVWQIVQERKGHSVFCECDLDDLCESEYARNQRTLHGYREDPNSVDAREAAKAIRVALEGYYHRRFAASLPRGLTLGEIIHRTRDAPEDCPLSYLKPRLQEVRNINAYAREFHHDCNPNADTQPVIVSELKTYVERALRLIEKG